MTTPSRRRFVAGAAWAAPALAVAAAAPALAASTACTAPAIPPLDASGWTVADLTPGIHNSQSGTEFGGGTWWSRDDVNRGVTTNAVETLMTTISVTAGCTYVFGYDAIKIQNDGPNQPDHTPQTVELLVNGVSLTKQTTDETSTSTPVLYPTGQSFNATYTATITGQISFGFRFTIFAPTGDNYGNDDIRISSITATAA